jgi:hypothetical protein
LAQWAAICAPITPAPSTATLRMISLLTCASFDSALTGPFY